MAETQDLQRLIVSLEANVKKYEKELARATGIANDSTRKIERNFDRMNAGVSAGLTKVAAFTASIISVGALLAFSKKMIEIGDNIGDIAERLGITTDRLQEMHYAVKLAGGETDEFDRAILALSRRIGGAGDQVDETSRALGRLGLSVSDLRGKKPDEVFKLLADRIRGVSDPFRQAEIAGALFGERLGGKLLPTLRLGSAELARLAAEAHKFGLVIPADVIEKASKAQDEFDRMSIAMRAAGVNISAGLLPALTQLREVMTDPSFQAGVRAIAEGFGNFIKWMVDNRETITIVSAALAGMVAARAGGPGMALAAGAIAGLTAMKALRSEVEKIDADLERLARSDARLRKTAADAERSGADVTLTQASRMLLTNETHRQALLKERVRLLDEVKKKEQEAAAASKPAEITVTKQGPFFDPDVAKALEDVAFKTRIARGEFGMLADGFPELVRGFEISRAAIMGFGGDIAALPPQLRQLNEEMRRLNDAKDLAKGAEDFGKAFGRAFEDAILKAKDFGDVLRTLGEEIARIMIRLLITNQLERALKASFLGVFGGIFGMAGGGQVSAGQPIMVGERGREVFVPETSGRIVPNDAVKPMSGGGGTTLVQHISIDARGADAGAVARIERSVEQMQRALPQQVAGIRHVQQVRRVRP